MKIVVQRVKKAKVSVDGNEKASIGRGLVLLIGICKNDGEDEIGHFSGKLADLRIFEDSEGKMNLNIKQVSGQVLSVPQFTLCADTRKGNRPGFDMAADPGTAKSRWESFNSALRAGGIEVKEGIFSARMEVELVNDGPVTVCLDR